MSGCRWLQDSLQGLWIVVEVLQGNPVGEGEGIGENVWERKERREKGERDMVHVGAEGGGKGGGGTGILPPRQSTPPPLPTSSSQEISKLGCHYCLYNTIKNYSISIGLMHYSWISWYLCERCPEFLGGENIHACMLVHPLGFYRFNEILPV